MDFLFLEAASLLQGDNHIPELNFPEMGAIAHIFDCEGTKQFGILPSYISHLQTLELTCYSQNNVFVSAGNAEKNHF